MSSYECSTFGKISKIYATTVKSRMLIGFFTNSLVVTVVMKTVVIWLLDQSYKRR